MANELQFLLDAPVAYADGLTGAVYGAATSTFGSTATNGTVVYKRCSGPCVMTLRLVYCQVLTAVTGGSAILFTAAVRPVAGAGTVASGTRVIGTITVPATAIAGDVCLASMTDPDMNINPGEELIVELTTKATTAGGGYVGAGVTYSLIGPTSGGSATTPVITRKPFGVATGQVKLVSS